MSSSQIVGLKTLNIKSNLSSFTSNQIRPIKKRVFTEDEINFLNTRAVNDLETRIQRGNMIISLLYNPSMLNMTQSQADMISSNLRYQIDTIREIIRSRQNGRR